MAAAIAEAPATGIGKLLTDGVFSVPSHQGNYRWNEDEVKQLFDDILEAMKREGEQYFLGLMVFMNSDTGEWVVLDGQQRLATTIMILAAVRTWLQQYSEYRETARQIQERYIGTNELGETTTQPRLHLNVANNDTFEKYVVNAKPSGDIVKAQAALKKFDQNKILLNAAIHCHERVAAMAHEAGKSEVAYKQLLELVKFIRDKMIVIRLLVSSEANAYTIFETLNDRGLELSPLDLVKNHMFGRAAAVLDDSGKNFRLRDMENRWVQMIGTLAKVKPGNFLKAFWTSRFGRTQSAKIFDSLKRQYKDIGGVVDLSVSMLAVAEQYAALESADDPIWAQYPGVRETIRSLKLLGSEQTHPVILAAMAKFAPPELERLTRLLEALIVRYQLIGGGRTGRLEISCARLARMIFNGEVSTATIAAQELKDVFPNDDEFQTNFSTKNETTNAKAAYLLRRLEKASRQASMGPSASELDPGISLTVEHILPRSPTEEWRAAFGNDDEIIEDAIYRMGNLCLIARNKELGRSDFITKKKIYSESDLETTNELAKYDAWNMEAVKRRQLRLAKLAVQAWRFQ